MAKRRISLVLMLSVLISAMLAEGGVFAEETWMCPAKGAYSGQICQCLEARRPGGAGAKSITDFVCPEPVLGEQDVAYRVILDIEFRKIDKEAEAKLKEMQARTGKDFVQMDTDIANWFDSTSEDAIFHKKYSETCANLGDPTNIFGQAVSSLWSVSADGSTPTFSGNRESCDSLVGRKLSAYKSAARIFAAQNVADSYKSDKKDFIDQLKDVYRNFLMKWMIYIGELSRIKSKFNEKTPIVN